MKRKKKEQAFGYTPARAGEEELLVLLLVAAASFALNSCGSTTVARGIAASMRGEGESIKLAGVFSS